MSFYIRDLTNSRFCYCERVVVRGRGGSMFLPHPTENGAEQGDTGKKTGKRKEEGK